MLITLNLYCEHVLNFTERQPVQPFVSTGVPQEVQVVVTVNVITTVAAAVVVVMKFLVVVMEFVVVAVPVYNQN